MERTIKIVGNGSLTIKPDTIRLLVNLEGTRKEYSEAVELSAQQNEELYSCLEPLGIVREELKTLSFSVNAQTQLQQDKKELWKQVLIGYRFFQSLQLDIPNSDENRDKIIRAITSCSCSPQVQLQHIVKDAQAAKNHLIEKAVADACNKAEILTRSAGVTLGEILSINYSWDDFEFLGSPRYNLNDCTVELNDAAPSIPSSNASVNLEPEDIKLSDTVMIIWRIQ